MVSAASHGTTRGSTGAAQTGAAPEGGRQAWAPTRRDLDLRPLQGAVSTRDVRDGSGRDAAPRRVTNSFIHFSLFIYLFILDLYGMVSMTELSYFLW